ncbi:MAG: TetR/AcrR family transcriptional regulator [Hyphomicrobiales bacterium]|nr:TetR/AcrR family transcriptional regulator [Hyphomicrobiales bacterium]MBV9909616.1 TetR/AcrR family transcriptional regulator [Hyphomicrobiales bacterium]
MSIPPSADARAPQRQRGRLRVAAILEAGAAAFREKGYDAVTMTEVAARSGATFGSLYRFFPSKEALANALLAQYAERALDRLAELAERAPTMTPAALTDALVDFMMTLKSERSFAMALMEAGAGDGAKREAFRAAFRANMKLILLRAFPECDPEKAQAMTVVVLHILKGLATATQEKSTDAHLLRAEFRDLLGLYLGSCGAEAGG